MVEAGPRWAGLSQAIPRSARHVDLDRIEDELDAHVCAYVALLLVADRADGGRRVRVLGEWAEGAIVTPVDDRHEAILAPA
jgi:predicted RNase H-like nuclease